MGLVAAALSTGCSWLAIRRTPIGAYCVAAEPRRRALDGQLRNLQYQDSHLKVSRSNLLSVSVASVLDKMRPLEY